MKLYFVIAMLLSGSSANADFDYDPPLGPGDETIHVCRNSANTVFYYIVKSGDELRLQIRDWSRPGSASIRLRLERVSDVELIARDRWNGPYFVMNFQRIVGGRGNVLATCGPYEPAEILYEESGHFR